MQFNFDFIAFVVNLHNRDPKYRATITSLSEEIPAI